MKCYTHNQAEAVAVCVYCGRAVCSSCATPSPSGRIVCSPNCAASSKQTEDYVAGTRNKTVRGARTTGFFGCAIGMICVIGAIAFHRELHAWPLTLFVSSAGIGFILTGVAYLRVAKRNSERGDV